MHPPQHGDGFDQNRGVRRRRDHPTGSTDPHRTSGIAHDEDRLSAPRSTWACSFRPGIDSTAVLVRGEGCEVLLRCSSCQQGECTALPCSVHDGDGLVLGSQPDDVPRREESSATALVEHEAAPQLRRPARPVGHRSGFDANQSAPELVPQSAVEEERLMLFGRVRREGRVPPGLHEVQLVPCIHARFEQRCVRSGRARAPDERQKGDAESRWVSMEHGSARRLRYA